MRTYSFNTEKKAKEKKLKMGTVKIKVKINVFLIWYCISETTKDIANIFAYLKSPRSGGSVIQFGQNLGQPLKCYVKNNHVKKN